ncbi:MAG: hypothetical protein AAFZ18_35425 [Myxococcota bacterium]
MTRRVSAGGLLPIILILAGVQVAWCHHRQAHSSTASASATANRSWWRSYAPERGSVVLTARKGGFVGGGLEVYPSDRWSLYLDAGFAGLDDEREAGAPAGRANFDIPGVATEDASDAVTYIIDAGKRVHLFKRRSFDLYLGMGVSWFGYDLKNEKNLTVSGGSLLARFGPGARWHFGRFSAGVDVGWYPFELLRFRNDLAPGSGDGFREVPIESRFEGDRFTVSFRSGFRF